MNKNQRKNRPKKKEVPIEKWEQDLYDLKNKFEYGGEHRGEKNRDPEKE